MADLALADVTAYLDTYLDVAGTPDHPNALNGLQVENGGRVTGIVAAVDACQATIDWTARESTEGEDGPGPHPLLLVHHGLFWDGLLPVTGRRHRRLRGLLDHAIALYGAHLPLAAHPEVGNNAVLARDLGVTETSPFGAYRGIQIGVAGALEIPRDQLAERLNDLLGTSTRIIPGGPERVRRVAVVTGAAANHLQEAREVGCDTLVTGEGMHHTYFDAMEFGVNLLFAGHYATEQVGPRALAEHLAQRFGLPWTFHHHPTGL